MKKTVLLIVTLVSLISVRGISANDDDSKKGVFKFEQETFDFGKIKKDVPVTHIFKFVNVGKEPIIIWNAKASCGCTEPKYVSTPVKEGASGEISVTFNAKAEGPFTKTVTISSNAQTMTKIIYIKGEVVE